MVAAPGFPVAESYGHVDKGETWNLRRQHVLEGGGDMPAESTFLAQDANPTGSATIDTQLSHGHRSPTCGGILLQKRGAKKTTLRAVFVGQQLGFS